VDEDRELRLHYAFVLGRPGYHVDVAEDGAAGWDALQTNRYHLLITENELPWLTGLELIRKLRAARMALPVVMAAGRLPTHELAQNPSLRLAATLLKPIGVDALLDTVKNVLRRKPPLSHTLGNQALPPAPSLTDASRRPGRDRNTLPGGNAPRSTPVMRRRLPRV